MSNVKGRGVRVEIAATYAAPKTVTALTLANPGVATSAAHGLANDTIGYWTITSGMAQLQGQATRVKNQATNTFELQGLSTASFSAFSGTPTYTPVATWGLVSEAIGYNIGGAGADQLDDSKLSDVVKQILFGLPGADVITVDLLSQTYNSSVMQAIEDAALATSYIVGRITLHDNSVRVFRGVPSRPGESLTRSQLATGQFQIAAKGVALKGAA